MTKKIDIGRMFKMYACTESVCMLCVGRKCGMW